MKHVWSADQLTGLPNDRRYLVGVSGGRDSVALLHWLSANGYRKLIVCHLEHGLRGGAGQADARFVARLAQRYDLQLEGGTAEVGKVAREKKQSIETAARNERLAFFARVARRRRCLTIFLAHHADDQVETFLMNLFRGAGSRGLGAMREDSIFGSLRIVRPLLGIWRAEIDAYIAEHRLKFHDDASNSDLAARRNRMRHKIIPYLEKQFGPGIRLSIWRATSIAAAEEPLLEELLPAGLTKSREMAVAQLRQLPVALQRRVLQQWLREQQIADVDYATIERVRGLLDASGGTAKTNLSRNRHARRRAGKIFVE
jgi:tRNA(Ile)-lysidine synthase